MAVPTVTVQQLFEAVRAGSGAPVGTHLADMTRLLSYCSTAVVNYAPQAPSNILDMAVIQLGQYLYDAPVSARRSPSNALSESGARAILAPYRAHTMFVAGPEPAMAAQSSDRHAIESVIRSVVAPWALLGNVTDVPAGKLPAAARVGIEDDGVEVVRTGTLDFDGSGVRAEPKSNGDARIIIPGYVPTPHQSAVFSAFRDGSWTPVAGVETGTPFVGDGVSDTGHWIDPDIRTIYYRLNAAPVVTDSNSWFAVKFPKSLGTLKGYALAVGSIHVDLGSAGADVRKVVSDRTYDYYSVGVVDVPLGAQSINVSTFSPFHIDESFIELDSLRRRLVGTFGRVVNILAANETVGLAVPNSAVRTIRPVVHFDPAYTLSADRAGVFVVSVQWRLQSSPGISIDDFVDVSNTIFTSVVLASAVYNAGDGGALGIEVSSCRVQSSGNILGRCKLWLARNAANQAFLTCEFVPRAGAPSHSFTIAPRVDVDLFNTVGLLPEPKVVARTLFGRYVGRWVGFPSTAVAGVFGSELDFITDGAAPNRYSRSSPGGTYEDCYEVVVNRPRGILPPEDNLLGHTFAPAKRSRSGPAAAWGDWQRLEHHVFLPYGPGSIQADQAAPTVGASFTVAASGTVVFTAGQSVTVNSLYYSPNNGIAYRVEGDRLTLAGITPNDEYSVEMWQTFL